MGEWLDSRTRISERERESNCICVIVRESVCTSERVCVCNRYKRKCVCMCVIERDCTHMHVRECVCVIENLWMCLSERKCVCVHVHEIAKSLIKLDLSTGIHHDDIILFNH